MGPMEVPDDALYGASTGRAVLNFPISGRPMPEPFIRAVGLLKQACATANEELGLLDPEKAGLIRRAAGEIAKGQLTAHFPVDVFQTGSATSTNTNANEVIANRASQMAGKPIGSKDPVHPNDHCNLGQSSNDTMPTALHLSLALALRDDLRPGLEALAAALGDRAREFDGVVKSGRTHLMDAIPLTLGQEFSGYAAQVSKSVIRVNRAVEALRELAIGGTAVGTGLNRHPRFPGRVTELLSERTGMTFRVADNPFEAQGGRDDCVEVAGQLAATASALARIADDVRLLGSGPRCGLGEIHLPPVQPGSSIMPGKVNPVLCEMLLQVCLHTHGLCATVVQCGREGQFELNATIPLIAHCLHESIHCLANGARIFAERCVSGITADHAACQRFTSRSLMLVTALTPHIGYDKAARVAKRAHEEDRTLREIVLEEELMEEAALDNALDPLDMTHPGD